MVDALENEDDLIVDDGGVVDDLVFELLVADVEPVGEVLPEFFL